MRIETSTIETSILKLLAQLHIVTHEQLFRLLPEFERHQIYQAINLLKNQDYLFIKQVEIAAPHSGIITEKTKKVSVQTYALNFKSRPIIQKKYPDLILYFRNNPQGLRYQERRFHDLLAVQALIYIKDRYIVADVFNEEFLQGTKQTMADLRLQIDDGTGNFVYFDIEIVASNNKKQIINKPKSSMFFTYSSYQADIIKELTGRNATIVTVNGDDIKEEKEDFTSQRYDELYEYIYYLDQRAGSLTAEALAIAFKKDVKTTKLICKELEENGHLFIDYAHLNIGDKGPRNAIYGVNRSILKEREDRVLSLMCSNLIVELKDNAEFGSLNRKLRIAYFLHKTGEQKIYFFDDSNRSILESYKDFVLVANHLRPKCRASKFIFQFSTEARINELNYLRSLQQPQNQ